jgi:sporulation protein YlmC with PRC-barrel domain
MIMMDEHELKSLVGHDVVDETGKSVGYLADVFNDRETEQPEWLGVLTGTIRQHHVLVPVTGAERRGSSLRVPWPKDRVKQAPTYDKEDRRGLLGLGEYRLSISQEKEDQAYAHYGATPVSGNGNR